MTTRPMCLSLVVFVAFVLEATADEPDDHWLLPGEKYTAYWLVNDARGERDEYGPLLLLSRRPFKALHQYTGFRDNVEQLRRNSVALPDQPRPILVPLLDSPALVLTTYRKDAIWNDDGRAIRHVGRISKYDAEAQKITIDSVVYRIEEATIEEAIHLLKNPEGTKALHRRHGPLTGYEQTAKALTLMLEHQRTAKKAGDIR